MARIFEISIFDSWIENDEYYSLGYGTNGVIEKGYYVIVKDNNPIEKLHMNIPAGIPFPNVIINQNGKELKYTTYYEDGGVEGSNEPNLQTQYTINILQQFKKQISKI